MPVRYREGYVPFYLIDKLEINLPQFSLKFISDLCYADVYNNDSSFFSWDSNNNGLYSEVRGNTIIDVVNLYPDVNIGRLPCSNVSELEIVIYKIINYEKNVYRSEWFNNIIVCGGNNFPRYMELWDGLIKQFSINSAWEGEYIGNRMIENMSSFNATRLYTSAMFPFGDHDAEFYLSIIFISLLRMEQVLLFLLVMVM